MPIVLILIIPWCIFFDIKDNAHPWRFPDILEHELAVEELDGVDGGLKVQVGEGDAVAWGALAVDVVQGGKGAHTCNNAEEGIFLIPKHSLYPHPKPNLRIILREVIHVNHDWVLPQRDHPINSFQLLILPLVNIQLLHLQHLICHHSQISILATSSDIEHFVFQGSVVEVLGRVDAFLVNWGLDQDVKVAPLVWGRVVEAKDGAVCALGGFVDTDKHGGGWYPFQIDTKKVRRKVTYKFS